MTVSPKIDVRDLRSIRRATEGTGTVILGDDWVAPEATADKALRDNRRRRRWIHLNRSPLARRIITFNLVALFFLVAGLMYLSPTRDNLAHQHALNLTTEAALIANVFEVQLPNGGPVSLAGGDGIDVAATLAALDLRAGVRAELFSPSGALLGSAEGHADNSVVVGLETRQRGTRLTDLVSAAWSGLVNWLSPDSPGVAATVAPESTPSVAEAMTGQSVLITARTGDGLQIITVTVPILHDGQPIGAVALTSESQDIEALIQGEREQLLTMFVMGAFLSIGLSLLLASTIANPLSDLADAAELGRDRNARKMSPGRIRIPDLTARPDEIGRLSGALRGMVSALYERIEGNEQFAADVAHEIKNPLASLRSAVGTLRLTKRDDQRDRLLEVIDHDVRRLDRLVSDISNASRLDAELVKEEEETFDLLKMLGNINEYLGNQAMEKGIDYITDMPSDPILIQGLEGRLAQVFVNIISNAISFCEDGDAIRVWARRRENRVLVVVEDTGPGIPEQALTKIFKRFYSERPAGQFGNNSGLGLAISKQIVEAHGGVIWAENIRPTEADLTSDALGARFVVGLPV